MTEGPYDYARERRDAEVEAARRGRVARRVGTEVYDDADVPDEGDL